MNKLTKIAAASALAFAVSLPIALPASAGQSDANIVVTQMEQWQENATRRLNRALVRSPNIKRGVPASGIVQLSFELGDNGRPTNVEVLTNSSNRQAAQTAAYAVRRMGDLSDVPVADLTNTAFRANVVFADSKRERRDLMAELERKERTKTASKSDGRTYIVLSN